MEEWRKTTVDDRYFISSYGNVKSNIYGTIRSLKLNLDKSGYYFICIKRKQWYIHRLVGLAFIPTNDTKLHIDHIDGDKSNNHVSNLEFATYSCNNQHAYDSGLHGKGENHYIAKLTSEDVRNIRRRGKYSTYEAIGNVYGVSKATIRDVLLHRTWAQAY